MKIAVGKTYETRDGRIARVEGESGIRNYPLTGTITDARSDRETGLLWTEEGRYLGRAFTDEFDLVREL